MKYQQVLLSIVIIACLLVMYLWFRVVRLEKRQQVLRSLPVGSMQNLSGNLAPVTSLDHILGTDNAKVTLIEYSDFECPSCQVMHPIYQKILAKYGNKVRFVLRLSPLPQNKNAEPEAEAAECVATVGGNDAFWQFSDTIFKRIKLTYGGTGFPLTDLLPLAKAVGIPDFAFRSCLIQKDTVKQVQREHESGRMAGVQQLPALFVVSGSEQPILIAGEQTYNVLTTIIDQALLPI